MGDFKKCFHYNVNYNENIKQWIFSIQPSSGLSRQHNNLLDKDTISAVYKTVYKIRYTYID